MTAVAEPIGPAFEPAGQADVPCATRSSALHFLKPLPLNLSLSDTLSSMTSTVVPGRLTVRFARSVIDFGLAFVPAFFGLTDASSVVFPAGFCTWAMAPPARASEVD